MTVAIAATPHTTATKGNRIALYITRKDITHGNIPKRSKKSLRLNLRTNSKTTSRSK